MGNTTGDCSCNDSQDQDSAQTLDKNSSMKQFQSNNEVDEEQLQSKEQDDSCPDSLNQGNFLYREKKSNQEASQALQHLINQDSLKTSRRNNSSLAMMPNQGRTRGSNLSMQVERKGLRREFQEHLSTQINSERHSIKSRNARPEELKPSQSHLVSSHARKESKISNYKVLKLEEDETVLKEGEMLKYRGGFQRGKGTALYVSRWVQVTENKLRYYKNQISAYQNPGKPLVSIPLSEILDIISTKPSKGELQFEFVLSKDLSTFLQEKNIVDKAYKSPSRNKSSVVMIKEQSPEREVISGHLMRIPHSRNNKRTQNISMILEQQDVVSIQNLASLNNKSTLGGKHSLFKTFEVSLKNQTGPKLQSMSFKNSKIQDRSFDGGPHLQNQSSWSKREQEWFEIEERIVLKNNQKNPLDGDPKNMIAFVKIIQEQQRKNADVRIQTLE